MVKVHIHKIHRVHTGNRAAVEVSGETLRECLAQLVSLYPGMREVIFESEGVLSPTVEIYVNYRTVYPEGLEKRLSSGDQVHLALLLAGG